MGFGEAQPAFQPPTAGGTLSRLHRYRDYPNQTQPGIDANVSMARRMLLFRALDQVEEEMGIRKKAKAGLHDLVRGKK